MFGRHYFGGRFFGPRFFGVGGALPPPVVITLVRLVPVIRNAQIPHLISCAEWCDSLTLIADTPKTYVPPGVFLRVNATVGPVYFVFNSTAAIPASDTTTGASSRAMLAQKQPVMLALPHATDTISFICHNDSILTIEAWS